MSVGKAQCPVVSPTVVDRQILGNMHLLLSHERYTLPAKTITKSLSGSTSSSLNKSKMEIRIWPYMGMVSPKAPNLCAEARDCSGFGLIKDDRMGLIPQYRDLSWAAGCASLAMKCRQGPLASCFIAGSCMLSQVPTRWMFVTFRL